MKNCLPFLLLAAVAMSRCDQAQAGDIALPDFKSSLEGPSVFLNLGSPQPFPTSAAWDFSAGSGPGNLLQLLPNNQPPRAIFYRGFRPFGASAWNRDPSFILRPDPNIDCKLIVIDPGFHRDDGIFDGKPDLRPSR